MAAPGPLTPVGKLKRKYAYGLMPYFCNKCVGLTLRRLRSKRCSVCDDSSSKTVVRIEGD